MSFYGKINYGTGQTPTSVSVTTSSTELLAANTNRKWCVLTNVGNKDVFLAIDATALVNKGILLGKGGGSIQMGADIMSTGALNGITASGTASVLIQEGI